MSPGLPVGEPYTSAELLQALEHVDLHDMPVTIVHYGERNAFLAGSLKGRGAVLRALCLYEWQLPDEIQPLQEMVHKIVRGEFDAVAFTSQIQCRHLLQVAGHMQMDQALVDALNTRTVVAAIGPTCRDAAAALGVLPKIVPQPPKMGALVAALAAHFGSQ